MMHIIKISTALLLTSGAILGCSEGKSDAERNEAEIESPHSETAQLLSKPADGIEETNSETPAYSTSPVSLTSQETPEPSSEQSANMRTYVDPACLVGWLDEGKAQDNRLIHGCEKPNSAIQANISEQNGWVHYAYQNDKEWGNGSVSTRPLGMMDDGNLVFLMLENWGGTGQFSKLVVAKPDPETGQVGAEHVQVTNFGDRCNGGVSEGWITDEQTVTVNVNMTPADLAETALDAANMADSDVAEFVRDLPFCAVCCAGSANYSYDLKSSTLNLNHTSFNQDGGLVNLGKNKDAQCMFDKVVAAGGVVGKVVKKEDLPALGRSLRECMK